ncbi:class I SAM-dependent methyltransferase [Streptomyces sulphureus]|uniref:class I SAM-dependent methyltransferase n=1 Tax=Streptomyces sulphureus TaxID=47758 RepID=UPI000378FC54|nr:class I SAM-dependent methyltransferase [Streptomyces sulphureus]
MAPQTYWNHNAAYHPELCAIAAEQGGRVLDIGCGDGLLMERLSPHVREVVGVDADPCALEVARERLSEVPNCQVVQGDFLEATESGDAPWQPGFDTVLCVASLHHMPLRPALRRAAGLLAPGGRLCVVGLAARRSPLDVLVAALSVLPIRFMGLVHREARDVGVVVAEPYESLDEIRRTAAELLPGSRVRRRLYYRYSLNWAKPTATSRT